MSVTKVKEYFKSFGIENKVIELEQSSATVELAAEAIGCDQERIAKTLSFLVGGKGILIVVAGDAKIDNRKYREEFYEKAKMIPFEEVESSRRKTIILFSDLSHHRTYRSVYGGSLEFNVSLDIFVLD